MFTGLYKVIDSSFEGELYRWTVELDENCDIYKVHFPGSPITPGACQLEIFRQLLSSVKGSSVDIQCVKSIKYLQLIEPAVNRIITVEAQLNGEKCAVAIKDQNSVTLTKASFVIK